MNPMIWYKMTERSSIMELPYTSSRYFRLRLVTNNGLPIQVDFGDGVINSLTSNVAFDYDAGILRDSAVRIFTPNRVTTFNPMTFSGQSAVKWNFSLGTFLQARNLQIFGIRSGNIFGNVVNLSRDLRTFQILNPSNGVIVGNVADLPSTIVNINCTSANLNFQHSTAELGTLSNLTTYTVGGISKVTGNIALLPPLVRAFECRNIPVNNRLHELSYNTTPGLKTWVNNMFSVILLCADGQGLTTAMIDSLLIDLDASTWDAGGFSNITITSGSGVRSSASDAAVASLIAKNVNVVLN
jgi:hypothetical protein